MNSSGQGLFSTCILRNLTSELVLSIVTHAHYTHVRTEYLEHFFFLVSDFGFLTITILLGTLG